VVEVPDDRGHPEPPRDAGPLSLAPSYAVLCALQAATVLLPRRRGARGRLGWLGVVAPALALGAGILVLRAVSGGPHALALLAAVAAPVLAIVRTPAAVVLWVVAWLADGLVAQLAGVAVIALAAVALAELAAAVAPDWSLMAGLVVLAVIDVVLVWGTPQVEPAQTALHRVAVGHGIPPLQDATFGGATMGWLDFVAPALLGVVVRARLRAAAVTGLAAGAWGLLLMVTSTVPATVPALAGLIAGRR
jgi:hypothetical protein